MKRFSVLILTLVFMLTMAIPVMAAPKVKLPRLPSVKYLNNAYITMTSLSTDSVSFEYGVKKPNAIANPLYVYVFFEFVVDNDNLFSYYRGEHILTTNDPLTVKFTENLLSGEPLRIKMVLCSVPDPDLSSIIKTLEIVFTPPIPNISTTITPSTVYAVQGQPLTLTARTFLDGTAFLSEEWYYPLNYIWNPDQTPTGYSLGTMVGETTADGYRVSTLTFDSFPAPGEYLFEYVVFNDLYGYSSSQSNGSITVVVSAAP